MLNEFTYYSRMALGIRELVRTPPLDNPEQVIREQLANRERAFLSLARTAVFGDPANPYHQMFGLAGCGPEDLEASVRERGLEPTLESLRAEGVYLTHDEFKGKQPIVRSGRIIASNERSFDNAAVAGLMESRSSGSRSRGTRTRQNQRCRLYRETHRSLRRREFGLDDRACILLWPILPSLIGITGSLRARQLSRRLERWYAVGPVKGSGHYRAVTGAMVRLANLMGAGGPMPTYLPENDFSPVARYIARRKGDGVECYIQGFASPAVRVAAAATEQGLDISGTLFFVAGEAFTPAKRHAVEAAGCKAYPNYWITEVGPVGYSCRHMGDSDRVHLAEDLLAVISHRKRAALTDTEVDALLFTTLLESTPLVLINAEMDDSGVIEPVKCDCVYSRVGFGKQIREIASYGKLTGLGVTLVGTDVARLLEENLPARLGGQPGDYQLVEREGAGQTELILRVSPRTGVAADPVKRCFLSELQHCYGGSLAARTWSHAHALEVEIGEPYATVNGKVLPLHLMRSGNNDAA